MIGIHQRNAAGYYIIISTFGRTTSVLSDGPGESSGRGPTKTDLVFDVSITLKSRLFFFGLGGGEGVRCKSSLERTTPPQFPIHFGPLSFSKSALPAHVSHCARYVVRPTRPINGTNDTFCDN